MTVVTLVPNNSLCANNSDLADRLRYAADRVASGDWGSLDRVIVVFDGAVLDWECYGTATNRAELVGLLEYAKQKVMT